MKILKNINLKTINWFTFIVFFFYVPLLIFRGLKVSIFDRRSVEDWVFGFFIYLIFTLIFPNFKIFGSILAFFSLLWCLFIWFLYRFPFDDFSHSIKKYFKKKSISLESKKKKITSPFGFYLSAKYLIFIYFWYFLILSISFLLGLAPILGYPFLTIVLISLIFIVLLVKEIFLWIKSRNLSFVIRYFSLGFLIFSSTIFLFVRPGLISILALLGSFVLWVLLLKDENEYK